MPLDWRRLAIFGQVGIGEQTGFHREHTNKAECNTPVGVLAPPMWRAVVKIIDDPWGATTRRFPHRTIKAGDVLCMLCWPDKFDERSFEPANAEAVAVARYFAVARGHPLLMRSAFDYYTRTVVLPALPEARVGDTTFAAVPAMSATESEAA